MVLDYTGYEYFKADGDEYYAAQYLRPVGQFRTELLAYDQADCT